jgi:hypothetical protein
MAKPHMRPLATHPHEPPPMSTQLWPIPQVPLQAGVVAPPHAGGGPAAEQTQVPAWSIQASSGAHSPVQTGDPASVPQGMPVMMQTHVPPASKHVSPMGHSPSHRGAEVLPQGSTVA